jgi:hypothetical protein
MNGNLTLERIMGPEPMAEFAYCRRCGGSLPFSRIKLHQDLCADCQFGDTFIAQQQRSRGARHNSSPEFEITVHYITTRYNRSRACFRPINEAGFTYLAVNVADDPIARYFVCDVLGHGVWPVITVTSYGRLLAHWAGHQDGLFPNRYSQLQGLYDQVQAGTAKPLSF